jgi:hypothetical protein
MASFVVSRLCPGMPARSILSIVNVCTARTAAPRGTDRHRHIDEVRLLGYEAILDPGEQRIVAEVTLLGTSLSRIPGVVVGRRRRTGRSATVPLDCA